jgi:hypothetical protein
MSFALTAWSDLAELYPPAGLAMQQVHDAAVPVVLDENRSLQARAMAFAEVASLNRVLKPVP